MSDSKATPPVTLSYTQARRFGPYSFASLALGLRERYVSPEVLGELLEEQVDRETDRRILSHIASFWKALATEDRDARVDQLVGALDALAEFEMAQSRIELRCPWLKAYVAAVLDRYSDPRRALEAMDMLHAVLGYPDELTPLTTYRSDPGVQVNRDSALDTSFSSETGVAESRNAAMQQFILSNCVGDERGRR